MNRLVAGALTVTGLGLGLVVVVASSLATLIKELEKADNVPWDEID